MTRTLRLVFGPEQETNSENSRYKANGVVEKRGCDIPVPIEENIAANDKLGAHVADRREGRKCEAECNHDTG